MKCTCGWFAFPAVFAAVTFATLTASATVRHVDYTNGADAGDATAAPGWKTLAYAVANADEGDEIVLAKGTHVCSTSLTLDKALHIHGAGEPSETVFDANHKLTDGNVPHLKITAAGVLVNNITFTRLCYGNYHNAGLVIMSGASVISNAVFTSSGISTGGDNKKLLVLSDGQVTRCKILDNVFRYGPIVSVSGSALMENCLLTGNKILTAQSGILAMSCGANPVVRNCTITGNDPYTMQAVRLEYASGARQPKFYNNIVWGNSNRDLYFRKWYANNMICNCISSPVLGETVDVELNAVNPQNKNTYAGKENVSDDPKLDATTFELTSISPTSVKTGAKVGADADGVDYCSAYDFFGNPRGDTPSMGAIQYVASAEMVVNVYASKTEVRLPETITLRCETEGAQGDLTYAWDFNNDGIVDSTEATPELATAGTYNQVSLTVSDGTTSKTATYDGMLTILPKFLDVTVSADQTAVRTPGVITLSATIADAVTLPLVYSWDLDGDGVEDSTEATPILSAVGRYVNPTLLRVTDAEGKYSDKVVLTGKYIIGPATPQTITVEPGDSLANVLDEAFDADEIVLKKGTHAVTSVLTIERPITIRGEGEKEETVLDANYGNNNSAFWHFDITASGAKVCNLSFTRFGHRYDSGYVRMSGDSVISNVVVTSCGRDANSGTIVRLSAGLLTHSWVTNNVAGYCAGVQMDGNSKMENCAILNNRSTVGGHEQGCALAFPHGTGHRTVRNCTIAGNTFANTNNAAIWGYAWDAAKESVRFYNNIVWGNTCTKDGALHPNAYNAASQKWFVKNNCWDYENATKLQDPEKGANYGTVNADPKFDVAKGGAPRITIDSPCRNAGSADYATATSIDIFGNARRVGRRIDIGCMESSGPGFHIIFR